MTVSKTAVATILVTLCVLGGVAHAAPGEPDCDGAPPAAQPGTPDWADWAPAGVAPRTQAPAAATHSSILCPPIRPPWSSRAPCARANR